MRENKFQRRHYEWLADRLGQTDIGEPEFNVVIWTLAQGLVDDNPRGFAELGFYEQCRTARKLKASNARSEAA